MSGQHTKGPWSTHQSHVYAPDGTILAQVHNPGSKASDYPLDANASLIAAAPELLAALDALVNSFEKHRPKEYWDAARAAISKARGEA